MEVWLILLLSFNSCKDMERQLCPHQKGIHVASFFSKNIFLNQPALRHQTQKEKEKGKPYTIDQSIHQFPKQPHQSALNPEKILFHPHLTNNIHVKQSK